MIPVNKTAESKFFLCGKLVETYERYKKGKLVPHLLWDCCVRIHTHIKSAICIPAGETHLDKCARRVAVCYLWLRIIVCMQDRVFPTLLWLEFEYEKTSPQGYSSL